MSVAVYPRLSELLRARQLTLEALRESIEIDYGLTVELDSLARLADTEPLEGANLPLAGAVAAVLGVGLDDLFQVHVTPAGQPPAEPLGVLNPTQSRRLTALLDQQGRGPLKASEQAELQSLVGQYGMRLHEQHVAELAQQRGVSVDQVEQELHEQLQQVVAWWRDFEADPARRRVLAAKARRRRGRAVE